MYEFLINLPAVDDFDNVDDIRVVLYQNGRFAHAPLRKLVRYILDESNEGGLLLLEGDEQDTTIDHILFEDESGLLLLN